MYSQNNEEYHILAHLTEPTGTFWDIGAFDGKTFSNTLALVERGWSGLMVEASPYNFTALLATIAPYQDRVTPILGACTGSEQSTEQLMTWWDSGGDATSTLIEAHRAKWAAGGMVFRKMMSATFDWEWLCKIIEQPDFINVDVEGHSADLAVEMFVNGMQPRMWCIEHDGRADELVGIFNSYERVLVNAENLILVKV